LNLKYTYTVFGLNVHSDFVLDELITGEIKNQPSIYIYTNKVDDPKTGLADTVYGRMQIFNAQFFFLHLKDHAKFLVTKTDNETHIQIDLHEKHDWPYTKSWLYGSILTAALQMNNRFAIHASAVLKDNALYLFCGNSGIGKSTIASQLHTKGFPLFSDDKCVLFWNEKDDAFYSYPSLKITRLWENSAEELSDDGFIHSPTKVALKQNKFQFLLEDSEVIDEAKQIHSIYRIHNGHRDSKLKLVDPTGIQKIKQLRNQTHRLGYVKGLAKQKIHWEYMTNIIQHVPYRVIHRPEGTPIATFVEFVEQNVLSN